MKNVSHLPAKNVLFFNTFIKNGTLVLTPRTRISAKERSALRAAPTNVRSVVVIFTNRLS